MADDDMPPPLEDMSASLEQAKRLRDIKLGTHGQGRSTSTATKPKSTSSPQISNTVIGKATHHKPSPSPPPPPAPAAANSQSSSPPVTEKSHCAKPSPNTKTGSGDFGGLKKGFLFGGSSKSSGASQKSKADSQKGKTDSVQSDKNQADSIPFIKPKEQEKDSGLKLDEVQQAMESTKGFLQDKEWVTEDLLETVQKNETLSRRLGDPRFMQAVTEFQTNPMEAMAKYQNNPEMQQFLQEFCGILGQHFSGMGDKDVSSTPQKPAPAHAGPKITEVTNQDNKASSGTQQSAFPVDPHVQQILSDPANREILMDPKVQQLIENLRSNPEKAQKMLHEGDTAFRQKVDILISLGLLKFQG
ncbi:uncharacterized protein [Littorina saxatilis]|uniref:STI1 domain-containing protein n=1 Tax=Littorina saxatilis TaxID=31220 RepID=A0AAN9GHL9_9CAEN